MQSKKHWAKSVVMDLLAAADITINGDDPWDIQVHNETLYQRVLSETELGLGESYMDGWWDCQRIDLFIARLLESKIESKIKIPPHLALHMLRTKLFNYQTKRRAIQVGLKHYDLGNDLFQNMLDKGMNYTCGYWKRAKTAWRNAGWDLILPYKSKSICL